MLRNISSGYWVLIMNAILVFFHGWAGSLSFGVANYYDALQNERAPVAISFSVMHKKGMFSDNISHIPI